MDITDYYNKFREDGKNKGYYDLGTDDIGAKGIKNFIMKQEEKKRDTNPKTAAARKKPPLWLVPPVLEIATSYAFADGAKKYGPYNWRETGVAATVYIEAAKRHLNRFLDGSNHADDSGVHELAHASACIAIILDAMSLNKLVDDRPLPGASNDLIEKREAGQLKLLIEKE